MGKFIDRKGHTYGKLTVVGRGVGSRDDKVYWNCLCSCGKQTVVASGDLATGHTVSCGCYNREVIVKHGGWNKSSYNSWRAMIRRCENPNDKDYPRYGGRGITVCNEWRDYLRFQADMGEPNGKETLDRIDNSKGYYKENCRWASPTIQAQNSRPDRCKYGAPGVKPTKSNKWIVSITANGKKYYSRTLSTLKEAQDMRKKMETIYWGNADAE